jgi:DNA-binding transcriptional ArsR family regulator
MADVYGKGRQTRVAAILFDHYRLIRAKPFEEYKAEILKSLGLTPESYELNLRIVSEETLRTQAAPGGQEERVVGKRPKAINVAPPEPPVVDSEEQARYNRLKTLKKMRKLGRQVVDWMLDKPYVTADQIDDAIGSKADTKAKDRRDAIADTLRRLYKDGVLMYQRKRRTCQLYSLKDEYRVVLRELQQQAAQKAAAPVS